MVSYQGDGTGYLHMPSCDRGHETKPEPPRTLTRNPDLRMHSAQQSYQHEIEGQRTVSLRQHRPLGQIGPDAHQHTPQQAIYFAICLDDPTA